MVAQRAPGTEVIGLAWEEFLYGGQGWAGMEKKWEPGQHMALVGPTGSGKSTAMVALGQLRKYFLALDPKGGDTTLKALHFPRLEQWPPPKKFWRDIGDGKPSRWIVGSQVRRPEDFGPLKLMLRRCLDDVFAAGGFTLYIDELELASRMMDLKQPIEMFLIAARDRGVSVVSAFQRPSYVPTTASSQTTWFVTYYTRDTDVVGRLGEMAGRPRHEMRGMVKGLGSLEYSLLMFSRNPREPVLVTKPPKAR